MPEPELRSGVYSSEYWVTLTHLIMSVLTTVGVVALSDSSRLESNLAAAVTAAFAFGGAAWSVVAYIKGRVALKSQPKE